jgi:diguanylate cyclase (GGDEF)-like protein
LVWWLGGDLAKIASRIPPLVQFAGLWPGSGTVGGEQYAQVLIPTSLFLTLGLALQTKALTRLCHLHVGGSFTIGLVAALPVAASAATALLPSLRPPLLAIAAVVLTVSQMLIIWREASKSRALTVMALADAIIALLGIVFIVRTAAGAPVSDLPPMQAMVPDFIASITTTFTLLVALGEHEHAYVRRMSITDPLTGALNRRGFIPLLDRAWRNANRPRRPMSLAILDIDHFKRLNDTFGHEAGDAVLAAFVAALTTFCRDRDVVARWGGEEFLLLMPDTSVRSAVAALKRIRAALPRQLEGCAPCPVTFSAGVYECGDFIDAVSIDALVARADLCLRQAKLERDCIVSDPPV